MLTSASVLPPSLIGHLAGVLAALQVIPYLVSIFAGKTRPQRTTYAIWSIINLIGITSYIAAGATTTIWVPLVYLASSWLIFGLSFKYGLPGFSRLDGCCLGIALATIALWVSTNSPAVAVYASCVAGVIARVPLMKKAWDRPDTESRVSWSLTMITSWLNVAALTSFDPQISLGPLLGVVGNTALVVILFLPAMPWRRRCAVAPETVEHGVANRSVAGREQGSVACPSSTSI